MNQENNNENNKEQNLENKSICDVGCGTGILSIISEKRGR